jgi:IclR family KDG regulon transcriptional repressor
MSSPAGKPTKVGPAGETRGAAPGRPRALPVESVRRALRILRCFTPERPELGVSDIARILGFHKSTTHRLLNTLELEGFVHRVDGGRYALSWTVLVMASSIRASQTVRERVSAHLTELASRTRETAHLAVMDRGEVLYIEKVEGSWSLRMPSAVGNRVPLHCTGLGKVMLAGLPEDEASRLIAGQELDSLTPQTITDPSALAEHIDQVRKQGYALDAEELEEGLVCIAAPVRDEFDVTCAAISIAGPAPRLMGHLNEHIAQVRATADALSVALKPYARTLAAAATGAAPPAVTAGGEEWE